MVEVRDDDDDDDDDDKEYDFFPLFQNLTMEFKVCFWIEYIISFFML